MKVRKALLELAEGNIEKRKEGVAFRHGTNRGRAFDFAILELRRRRVAYVRLTRFRHMRHPREPMGNSTEAATAVIENEQQLRAILWLARESLALSHWILVDTKDFMRLAREKGYSET